MFSRHKSRLTLGVFSAGFGFLLVWTLGVHLAAFSAWPFWTLYVCLGLACAAGAFGALKPFYPREDVALPSVSTPTWTIANIGLARLGAVSVLTAVFLVTAGIQYKTSFFLPFWGASLLVGIAALAMQDKLHPVLPIRFEPQSDAAPRDADVVFLVVALIAVVFYLFTSIPDTDDALFLNFAVGSKEDRSAIFSTDTMLGLPGLDFITSTYRLEGYQLLAAIISDATGWSVLFAAHTVLPTLICIWGVSVLALVHNSLFPNHFAVTLAIHMLVLVAMDGALSSFGYHAIPRLFQGKAPFLVAIIPLITVLTVMSLRHGSWQALGLLCGAMVISVGLTANAIYVAPLCVALIALVHLLLGGKSRWRVLRLFLIVIYPGGLAGYLLVFDPPGGSEIVAPGSIGGALWGVFGTPLVMVIALAAIFTAVCMPLLNGGTKAVAIYTLGFLACVLNPFVWPYYGEFVTGNINYRLFWTVPIPLVAAAFLGLLWTSKSVIIRTGIVA